MLIFLSVLGGIGVLYFLGLLLVSVISLRPPRVPIFLSPAQLGMPQESVDLVTTDGIKLRGWWVQGGEDTVIVCIHGYLANRCELVPYVPRLREMGASVLLFDLRCHGSSERARVTYGSDEAADVLAALRYVRARLPSAKTVVFASSMGAVAALRAAVEAPDLVDALILDGTYGRLDEAARGFWEIGGFKAVAKLLAPTAHFGKALLRVDPKTVVTRPLFEKLADKPMLLLYGTADTVVPLESAQDCVNAAGTQGRVVWFEGCGHSGARYSQPELYFDSIASFLTDNELVAKEREDEKSRSLTIKPVESLV